ncbi:pilus assembly protein CpaE [Lacrimispora amygdalina]|uniref:Stage 0 sporulation protein A homolog n=2 Tax=Lacrimispora amygdalina TaxID=253257 RepID=A0ABQ5M984_9FIRM
MDSIIRVVIADDSKDARDSIKSMLELEKMIEVVGEAGNGIEAVQLARETLPDIILMDINMPVKDGISATEEINVDFPEIAIIMISVQNEREYLRKAMVAGAREFVAKPFSYDDLLNTIKKTYELELKRRKKSSDSKAEEELNAKIISVYSSKGGSGKTTIATNLAVSLAKQTKKRVALIDLDLLFGNVSVHMNITSKNNIAELVKVINSLDDELLDDFLMPHISGVRVLTAPIKPEYSEYINEQHVKTLLSYLKKSYHYVIIDTCSNFAETTLAALDASEKILYLSTLDLPSIKNAISGLEVMETLNYDKTKVHVVINKATEIYGVKLEDFEKTVGTEIWAAVPEDYNTVIRSHNKGLPFVMTRTKSPVQKSLDDMGSRLIAEKKGESLKNGEKKEIKKVNLKKSFFGKVLEMRS